MLSVLEYSWVHAGDGDQNDGAEAYMLFEEGLLVVKERRKKERHVEGEERRA